MGCAASRSLQPLTMSDEDAAIESIMERGLKEDRGETVRRLRKVSLKLSTKKRVLINGIDGLFERVNERSHEALRDAARGAVYLKPGERLLLNRMDDTSYVMERGCVEVRLPGDDKPATIYDNGREVPRKLLEERPPAVVMVAQTFTKLWATEKTFLTALRTHQDQQQLRDCERLLKDAPLLAELSDEQRRRILGVLTRGKYHNGEFIIRQGELGSTLFMLLEGAAMATNSGTNGTKVLTQYTPGSCFGEMALLTEGRRLANVVAVGDCEVACIDKASIERLVGPLRSVMGKHTAQAMEEGDNNDDKASDMDVHNVTTDVDDAYDMEHDMSEGRERRLSMAVRGRRRTAVCTEATPGCTGWVPRKPAHGDSGVMVKTADLRKRLCAALKRNLMFKSLDQAQLEVMVGAMTSVHVQSGDQVIRQGDAGDLFYVVDSGEFEVYVASAGASDTKVMDVMNGGSFGELALMYGSPRAATVRAVSDGRLWALDRTTFRRVVIEYNEHTRHSLQSLLNDVPILEGMTEGDRALLADAAVVRWYTDGEYIVRQGEVGDKFCILVEGQAFVTQISAGAEKDQRLTQYVAGAYFGEIALLCNELRKASVISSGPTKVAELSADVFQRLMGDVQAALRDNLQRYKATVVQPPLPEQPQPSSVAMEKEAIVPRTAAATSAIWSRPPHPLGGGKKDSVVMRSIPSTVKEAAPMELTAETQRRIMSTIKQNIIFANLDPPQLKEVCRAMTYIKVRRGDAVIRQGDAGDNFYCVAYGEYDVSVVDSVIGGSTKVAEVANGGSFGELALMYGSPRAATVTARTDGGLWALDRHAFRSIVVDGNQQQQLKYEAVLEKVGLLESLSDEARAKVAAAMHTMHFADGEYIICQGEVASTFFILLEGAATATRIQAGQAEPTACMQYTPGSYFGEIALLYKERRRANVVADGACTVGAIDRGAFKRLLGPLADILEDGMLQYSTISDDVHVPSTPPQHTPRTEQVAVESVNDTR